MCLFCLQLTTKPSGSVKKLASIFTFSPWRRKASEEVVPSKLGILPKTTTISKFWKNSVSNFTTGWFVQERRLPAPFLWASILAIQILYASSIFIEELWRPCIFRRRTIDKITRKTDRLCSASPLPYHVECRYPFAFGKIPNWFSHIYLYIILKTILTQ